MTPRHAARRRTSYLARGARSLALRDDTRGALHVPARPAFSPGHTNRASTATASLMGPYRAPATSPSKVCPAARGYDFRGFRVSRGRSERPRAKPAAAAARRRRYGAGTRAHSGFGVGLPIDASPKVENFAVPLANVNTSFCPTWGTMPRGRPRLRRVSLVRRAYQTPSTPTGCPGLSSAARASVSRS